MARRPAQSALSMIELPTTAAVVICNGFSFDGAEGPSQDFITMQIYIVFNGASGETSNSVIIARNATTTQKQNAIRTRLNELLAESEAEIDRTVTLNNANIQISGLPV